MYSTKGIQKGLSFLSWSYEIEKHITYLIESDEGGLQITTGYRTCLCDANMIEMIHTVVL